MKTGLIYFIFLFFAISFYSCRNSKNNQVSEEVFWNPEMVDTKPEMITSNDEFLKELNKALSDSNMIQGFGEGEHLFKFRLMINKEGHFTNLEFDNYKGPDTGILRNGFPKINKLIDFLKTVKFAPAKKESKSVGSFINIQLSVTLNNASRIIRPWQIVSVYPDKNILTETSKDKIDDKEVYTFVDQMPEYPGGTDALLKFITSNIKYPVEAKQKGVEGKVLVQFIVGKTGDIDGIKVLKGIGAGCDDEAVRVCKMMRPWIPGKLNGKPVPVKMVLPFHFKLD